MVPLAREAHLAVLMIGYSDPLVRRLASLARPSPPDGCCGSWLAKGLEPMRSIVMPSLSHQTESFERLNKALGLAKGTPWHAVIGANGER
jgi:hypothetical protein